MPVRIPILDAVQGGGQLSQIKPASALAVDRAIGNAADTANKGFQGALGVVNDIQAVKNDGKLSDLKSQAKQAAIAYDASLATNKDPTSWAPGFNKAMDDFTGQAGLEGLSPDVRAAYSSWQKEFKSTQGLKYQQDANVFSIEQAKVAKDNSIQRSIDLGDFPGAVREIQNDPMLSDSEKQAGVYKVQQREAKFTLEGDISIDPKGTLDELKSESWLKTTPGATVELRKWGIAQAESAYQKAQKDEIDGVVSDIKIGNIVTEDQLKERLDKAKNIGDMRDEVEFHFKQSKPLDQETRFGLTDALNATHDAYTRGEITLEEYRTSHDGLGQVIYSMGTRDGAGELRQRLHNLDPTNWGASKAPKDTRIQTVQKLGKIFEDSGAFGNVSDDDKKKLSPFDLASKQTEIYNARQNVESVMESWLKSPEGKEANEEQISEKFKSIFLDKAASKILRPGGAWATQPEVEDYINSSQNTGTPSAYGYQISTSKDLGLDDYFKKNPNVAGMAWGGGENGSDPLEPRSVVFNPYNDSMKDPEKRAGLYKIEAARHLMAEEKTNYDFPITPELQKWREETYADGEVYKTDDALFRETMVSRELVGDAPVSTPEIKAAAKEINRKLEQRNASPKGASSQIKVEPVGSDLTSMVKHFEAGGEKAGFHAKAYWDEKQWSIGYGTPAKEGEVITQPEAEKRLAAELDEAKKSVLRVSSKYKLEFSPHEIDALTSFTYNAGSGSGTMKEGLEGLLKGGTRSKEEIASMMLQYNKSGGVFLIGLLNRRKAESSLFKYGYKGEKRQAKNDPQPEPDPNSAPSLNTGDFAAYNVVQDG